MRQLGNKNRMEERAVVSVSIQVEIKVLGVLFYQSGTGQSTRSLISSKTEVWFYMSREMLKFFPNHGILHQFIQFWLLRVFPYSKLPKCSALKCMKASC